MTRQTKPVFSQKTETVFADAIDMKATDMRAPDMNAKDLGIEFVHFDNDGNIENQHTMPLGQLSVIRRLAARNISSLVRWLPPALVNSPSSNAPPQVAPSAAITRPPVHKRTDGHAKGAKNQG